MIVEGKKVLITHTLVQNIMGSTVVALDIAQWFRAQGALVTVFAGAQGLPMIEYYEYAGIPVIIDEKADLHLDDFDLIWVQSQVLPLQFAKELSGFEGTRTTPVFVFNHMSGLDLAPDEHPYILGLEDRLSSLSLFVSEEARDLLAKYYDDCGEVPKKILPNGVSSSFIDAPTLRNSQELQKLMVVSNHFTAEMRAAINLLRAEGVNVVTYGSEEPNYDLITAEIVADCDAVMSIGRTVQYCLVAGVPVFVYDYLGGFGYLNDDVLLVAAMHNFSGRGGWEMKPEDIVDRLMGDYSRAKQWHEDNRSRFAEQYSLDGMMSDLMTSLSPREYEAFDERFGAFVYTNEQIALRYYRAWSYRLRVAPIKRALEVEKKRLTEKGRLTEKTLAETQDAVRSLVDEKIALQTTVEKLKSSNSWRLGRFMSWPYRKVRHAIKKAIRRP